MASPIRKEALDQYRVHFAELAKVKRGEAVLVDPFLIARAVALVMRECTVRSAAGRPILWNDYRVILARPDFELVRALQGPLERDLAAVLAQEAQARQAELVGALRITVVFDEADELPAGAGVVRVGFVPTERLAAPRAGEMTVRFDGWAVDRLSAPLRDAALPGEAVACGGEIAARPKPPGDTVFVEDAGRSAGTGDLLLSWTGGQLALPVGATVVAGRPHPDAPPQFVSLTGAGAKVNKQHFWIAVGTATVRIGRLPAANPVHVDGRSLAAGEEVEVTPPCELALSHGDLAITLRRR